MEERQHAWAPVTPQDTAGATPSRKLRLPSASSAPSTDLRHERRRTAAHLLAIDPEGATDLGHLRTRFARRQRTKEAAEILHGGSATTSAVSMSESLQRSDSFSSTTSGLGGSYRGGSYRGGGSFANFSGSFLSNVGLDSVRANGSARSDWNDQWSRGGSWMSRGGSWMSFADDSDLQLDDLHGDSGADSFLSAVDAAKQQLLQCRAAFHDLELEQVLREQLSGSANAMSTLSNGIEEAMREYDEGNRQAAGPSVDSKELLEHPQRMPNLLRASSTCAVGLVSAITESFHVLCKHAAINALMLRVVLVLSRTSSAAKAKAKVCPTRKKKLVTAGITACSMIRACGALRTATGCQWLCGLDGLVPMRTSAATSSFSSLCRQSSWRCR